MTTSAKVSTPRGIDAVYYMIQDTARARRFYEEFLGFVPSHIAEGGEWEGAEYEMPTGQTFGVGKTSQAPWRAGGGMMLSVDDVAQAAERVFEAQHLFSASP